MAASKNERNTENIVRAQLSALDYYSSAKDIQVEEQKSNIVAVKTLLKNASKSGKSGQGAPEFIISSPSTPDFLLIVECKADVKDHQSELLLTDPQSAGVEDEEVKFKRVQRFAVDGVLHYAQKLSKDFNVIAIAVSGEKDHGTLFSAFLHPKGASAPKPMQTKDGSEISRFISWDDFIEHGTFDPTVQRLRLDELMAFSRDLHDFMRDHAKLTENQKPLLVSGTLIALRNQVFAKSYDLYSPEELQKQWMRVIQEEMEKADIPKGKKTSMTQPYSGIAVHPELGKSTTAYPKGVLHELVRLLNEKVWPFISIYHDFDVVGQFYGEFLKYTGGDKKALGIVL